MDVVMEYNSNGWNLIMFGSMVLRSAVFIALDSIIDYLWI